jgi:hypothetical protein
MNANPKYQDAELEVRINEAHLALLEATTRTQREVAALKLSELVKLRSPKQVREMEKARGLGPVRR